MSIPTRQNIRVEHPFVRIPLRHPTGAVEQIELWREDHLDPNDGSGSVYLVLDFLEEQRLLPGRDGEAPRYTPTGKLVLELQAVDAATGEGLAAPHERAIQPDMPTRPDTGDTEHGGAIPVFEFSTKPLTNLVHIPRSPRRD